jgi:hypothetical protein
MKTPIKITLLALALAAASGEARGAEAAAPAAAAPAKPARAVERFALVVGNNTPPRAGLALLRYADDDALRWAGLFETFGAEVELLATLDAETQRLAGAAAPARHAATRPELDAAMSRLRAGMQRARQRGSQVAFFFVYAGHGDTDEREGYVALEDGPFHRSDLEEKVLAASTADTNHVIVDACRSAYLAYDRGPGGSRRPWTEPYFGAGAMARFRNTGFLLANSMGGASHEWEEFQAGIFSHELRSGLLGGADANGDGRITYRELASFVRVANGAVRNEKYRPSMLAIPPRAGDEVVIDLSAAAGGRVKFSGRTGRHVLEDQLGVRWADVHPGRKQDLTLVLPKAATERLYVRTADDEAEYSVARDASVTLAELVPTKATVSRRGAVNEAFAQLFAEPFDASVVGPNLSLTPDDAPPQLDLVAPPPAARRGRRIAEVSLLGGSAVAFGTALYFLESARSLSQSSPSGVNVMSVNDQIGRDNMRAETAAIAGGLLAAAAAALYLWDRHTADSSP